MSFQSDILGTSSATFSPDGKERLHLLRSWNTTKPPAMVIGLNPSTANGTTDDATIRTLKSILNNNGFGALVMVNLFTMITPYPQELIRDDNQEAAIEHWRMAFQAYHLQGVIFAWGRFDTHGRDKLALKEFPNGLCFGKNLDGSPKHPLYLKRSTKLYRYDENWN